MILNSPVSATFLCMLKETILLSIFSFWIESHPYMFLSALYSFLGKESKCSNVEITVLLLSAFQVLPDKGMLTSASVPASLDQRKQEPLLPFSWPITNHQTNPSPSSPFKNIPAYTYTKQPRWDQTKHCSCWHSKAKPNQSLVNMQIKLHSSCLVLLIYSQDPLFSIHNPFKGLLLLCHRLWYFWYCSDSFPIRVGKYGKTMEKNSISPGLWFNRGLLSSYFCLISCCLCYSIKGKYFRLLEV